MITKKVIRLTENDLVRIVKRVIGEEEKQNLFPDAPISYSNDSTFTFNSLRDGYYQVYPTNTLPHEVYKYISNFNSNDREDIWEHIYKRTFIEASGEFNRIHFREGIHPFLQGLGMGYIIYEDFIKFLGYASSTDSATEDSKRVWKKLIKDPDFYGVYCNNGDVLAVYKNWGGDIPSLIKSFIRGRNNVSFISDNLLSDYPELNDVMKLSESDLKRIVKRVIGEGEENLEKLKQLQDAGLDNLKAYFLSQLDENYTWYNLFQAYGETVSHELFDNDPFKFLYFAVNQSDDEMIKKFYPKFNDKRMGIFGEILVNYFFGGDENMLMKFYQEYKRKEKEKIDFSDDDPKNIQKVKKY